VNPQIDIASHNTSLTAAQLIVEFLGRIVEHPGYRKRHPMKAAARISLDGRGRRNGRRIAAKN
jgi:hypothetical protein